MNSSEYHSASRLEREQWLCRGIIKSMGIGPTEWVMESTQVYGYESLYTHMIAEFYYIPILWVYNLINQTIWVYNWYLVDPILTIWASLSNQLYQYIIPKYLYGIHITPTIGRHTFYQQEYDMGIEWEYRREDHLPRRVSTNNQKGVAFGGLVEPTSKSWICGFFLVIETT